MKKIISIIVAALLLLCMVIPASAASYGFNIGAIQGSVSNAVEQEIAQNPTWYEEWLADFFSRWAN